MKRLASVLLTVLLLGTMIPFAAMPVSAAVVDRISCLVWENGSFVTQTFEAERLDSNFAIYPSVHIWYAAAERTVFRDRVKLPGEYTIILCDGADLVFENGIQLEYGGTLNIYAQSQSGNMGKLTVYGYGGNAAIGGNRGIDCAEDPLARDGRPGGTVNIHGGNIDVYSESVGFGGGDGGIGIPGGEGENGSDGERGGDGGDAVGGAIYGGNVVLHTGRALFGGGAGGKGGEGRAFTSATSMPGQIPYRYGGDGGNGGSEYHVRLYGGSVQLLAEGADLIRGGNGGNGGDGAHHSICSREMHGGLPFHATWGGNGGDGGDVRDVQFWGDLSVSGSGNCIAGGDGGCGGKGGDISINTNDPPIPNVNGALCSGSGGNGGNGGHATAALRGGNSTVTCGSLFCGGGNAGGKGPGGKPIGGSYGGEFQDGPDGTVGTPGSCELTIRAGALTVSTSGKLMRSGNVYYYDYMTAQLGRTLFSLGQAARYNAGQLGANACAVFKSTPGIVPPVEHDGNNYWLNGDYDSKYFLLDEPTGHVTLDLNGHTWTVTGDKTFGEGVTMLEIKNGTLIFTNPNMEAFVIENGLILTNVTFKDCTCKRLFQVTEKKATASDCPEFTVRHCTFTNCSFTENGGAFFFNCAKSSPRWYYLFENDLFNNLKTTESGSAMYISASYGANYGGMFNGVAWPSLELIGCTFNGCHADRNGGAIYAFENMRIGNVAAEIEHLPRSNNNLHFNLFVGCSAGEHGGALFNAGYDSSTLYCMFVSCTSKTGAVYAGQQPVHFSMCDFFGNNGDIYHDDSYHYTMETQNMVYDMSQYPPPSGQGTENSPYILKSACDIAFLAGKCKAQDTKYSYAVYQLGNDITDVFTPVPDFNGILIPDGKKIMTRFTGVAFTGNYGIQGTLTVKDLLGNVSTEEEKSNFRHMESTHNYNRNTSEGRTYIRPGALSLTLTFSGETRVRGNGIEDAIIIYDSNGNPHRYEGDDLRWQTITIPGDTAEVWVVACNNVFPAPEEERYGFKVVGIQANYSTGLGMMISQGNIWIIAAGAVAILGGIVFLVIAKKKQKHVLAGRAESQSKPEK